jgi:hypothetical protein
MHRKRRGGRMEELVGVIVGKDDPNPAFDYERDSSDLSKSV